MDSMDLANLYNELSSKVRLTILGTLWENEARFSDLVKEVGLSSPEVSRHLKRLQDTNLIEKKVDGGYKLSLFGEMVMRMTANMPSLMDKSEYFITHDTSAIPLHLLRGLEALMDSKLDTVFAMMGTLYTKLGDTEFFWDISNQMSSSENSLFEVMDLGDLDFDIRFLVSLEVLESLSEQAEKMGTKIKIRVIEDLNFSVTIMSTNAMLALPDKSGVIDRNTYIMGDTPEFIEWCKKLYMHYWEKAEKY